MARIDRSTFTSQNPWRAQSFVRGFCTCLLGFPWQVHAEVPQVVMEAGRSPQMVMACVQPEITGIADPSVGKAFMDATCWDLAHSGAVRPLMESDLPASEQKSHLAMRQAGASLLMKASLKRSWTGKLIIRVEVTDLGSESRVFRKAYSGDDSLVLRIAHHLVDDMIGALTGIRGVAGSRIVFVHKLAPGRKEIFQVDPDGKNLIRITRHESLTISPSVCANGKLSYVTYVGGLPHIWGQRKRGDTFRCLYPLNPRESAMAFTPEWSPDGKRLALVQPNHWGGSDISVMTLENGKLQKITDKSGINTEPTWNPSGNQLAFTSDRAGTPQIYLMETDGSNVRRLTLDGTYNASPSWSPDGSMLAYVSRMDGRFNLFVYKLAEGKAYQVTRGVESSESPAWSPDGRWIAFASDQDGKRQLHVVDTSGTILWKVLELPNCQSPQWTRSR